MARPVGEVIAHCPKCGKPIGDENPYTWCIECGEGFTPEIKAKIPSLVEARRAHEKPPPFPSNDNDLFSSLRQMPGGPDDNWGEAVGGAVAVGILGAIILAALGIKAGLIGALPAVLAFFAYKAIRNK